MEDACARVVTGTHKASGCDMGVLKFGSSIAFVLFLNWIHVCKSCSSMATHVRREGVTWLSPRSLKVLFVALRKCLDDRVVVLSKKIEMLVNRSFGFGVL